MFLVHESPGFGAANVDVACSILPPLHVFALRQEDVVVSGCLASRDNQPRNAGLRFGVSG